jgi:hypothetical protein
MAIVVIFPAAALGHARSGAMIYLVVGVVIGPVVSLFAIRIHLRVSERDRLWMSPLRLCGPAMLVTIELMSGFNARRRPLALGTTLFLAASSCAGISRAAQVE